MLKLQEIQARREFGYLSQLYGAKVFDMSGRTFRRWARRFVSPGEAGPKDHWLGRRAGHSVQPDREKEVARL